MTIPTNFNWRDYLINNIDLQQARIRYEDYAIEHYKKYGYRENRKICNEPYISDNHVLSDDYTFVILRCVRKEKFSELWINCYNSIRKFHPNNKIVIIDNNSNYKYIKNIQLENVELIQHNKQKCGEILPFYYFLKKKWSKYIIYFQDSMYLNRPLCADKLNVENFKFFWHFYQGVHDNKKVITHQINQLTNNEELHKLLKDRKNWFGSFGLSCTMSLQFLEFIEKKHNFTNLVNYTNCREDRKGLERVLGLLCSLYQFKDVYNSYFGPVCICPNFGKNEIEDYNEPKSEAVQEWEQLFCLSKVFVCR